MAGLFKVSRSGKLPSDKAKEDGGRGVIHTEAATGHTRPGLKGGHIGYVKFRMSGVEGIKQAVFIPKEKLADPKLLKSILMAMKKKPPNLLICSVASASHPLAILDETEIQHPALQNLHEGDLEHKDDILKEVLAVKLKSVVSALLAAAEQTQSATYTYSVMPDTFFLLASMCLDSGAAVDSFVAMDVNDRAFLNAWTRRILKTLWDGHVQLDVNSVKAFTEPIQVDGSWLGRITLAEPFEGRNGKPNDVSTDDYFTAPNPGDKGRHPWTLFPWPDGDLFLIAFQEKDGDIDWETDAGLTLDPFKDLTTLAPPANIFMGGKSSFQRAALLRMAQEAIPTVVVNYTGGLANLASELLKALSSVIEDDVKVLKKLVKQAHAGRVRSLLSH